MKTLILGIGNPILRDDGIGLRVIEELEGLFFHPEVTLLKTSLAGLGLLDLLAGFGRAIIVDAIQTGGRPGEIHLVTPEGFITRHSFPYLHNIDFFQTLMLGKELIQQIPDDLIIVAIEAEDVCTFGEGLTAEVERAVPQAVEAVLSILGEKEEETSVGRILGFSCP